jgi:ferredoxin-NADP reductase
MPAFLETAPTSVLAFATTLHLAMAALRNHRSPGSGPVSSLAFVSALLAGSPWLMPTYAGLIFGLAAHMFYYAVCERLVPQPAAAGAATARSQPPASFPASTSRPGPRPARSAEAPKGFVQLPVLAVFEETSDIRTFRLARPDGFDFKAGQFLPIRVRTDGHDHIRCYSLSSAPETSGYLEISVKRQGLVSDLLHATLRPGTLLSAKAPAGSFIYPAGDDRPLLLVAGGIGITPVLSMLRHAVNAEPTRRATLLYSVKTEVDLAFRDELTVLAARHPQVKVVLAATRGAAGADVYPGRIDEALIRATVPDLAHAVALMCGPQPMIDGMRATLVSLGMPADQVRSELFEAVVAATGGTGAAPTEQPAGSQQMHEVRCVTSGAALQAASGQTLLDAAESGGVAIDSICRSGVCGTCRTRVIEGDVHCDSTLIDDADRQEGFVLACVSQIRSDCVIEA